MPTFLNTPLEKLKWLASRNPNPTREQIRESAPDFIVDNHIIDFLYWEIYMLKWYDEVANEILVALNEEESDFNDTRKEYISLDNPKLIDMVDKIYHDVINNNKWGFIFI